MNKLTITLILLCCYFGDVVAQSATDSLDNLLTEAAATNTLIGFSVALIDAENVYFTKGYGYADIDKKIPYTTQSRQPIASISKTLIGVSLMKAQELNKLKLDDDINKYLPFKIINPHQPNEVITIRHLASHTSGLKDTKHYERSYVFKKELPDIYKNYPVGLKRFILKKMTKRYNKNQKMEMKDFFKAIYTPDGKWYKKGNFLKNKPGEKYEYSNNGAAMAALVIEGATGMDYREFVKTHILEPTEMTGSGWSMGDFTTKEKTNLYFDGYALPEFNLITYPDGGFVTNMDDFVKYIQTMIAGYQGEDNIIKAESYQNMMTRKVGKEVEIGVFWAVYQNSIGHSGGDPGVTTFAYFNKNTGLARLLFINTSDTKKFSEDINVVWNALKTYSVSIIKEHNGE